MRKFIFLTLIVLNLASNELQEAINNAKNGDTIELGSGVYKGNITINKPLTIDGINKTAIIVGDENGSVINITSPNVVIKNLTITNSGKIHADEDSAIKITNSNNVEILNNKIKDTLFGVTFLKSNNAKVIGNEISSYDSVTAFKGDALKFWYSHDNKIIDNNITNSRDAVFWYSSKNLIKNNHGKNCRYSLHFMYSSDNLIQNNTFDSNKVGIFFMFSKDTTLKDNLIKNSIGAYGVAIGMKDSSNLKMINNKIIYNARGFYLDQSPYQPNTINEFVGNLIAYNSVAVQFHALLEKSIFKDNTFKSNIEVALNDTPGVNMNKNEWSNNYFDDYDGFDLDKDGFGDTPYLSYSYADKLWQHRPSVRFFYGSNAISLLNFIAKLAPFSEPEFILKDERPRTKAKDEN